jgi:hypothetical protein
MPPGVACRISSVKRKARASRNLDAQAQVFFSTDSSGNLLWTPLAGASVVQGFYPIDVSAVFGGYDAEDSQFTIQVTA